MKKNPLSPRPQNYSGPAASGGTQEGVHTADTLEQAIAYANLKGAPPDYPVVIALDTSGLKRIPDLDVERAAERLQDNGEAELKYGAVQSVVDLMGHLEETDEHYFDAGDPTQNLLFAETEPAPNAAPALLNYLESRRGWSEKKEDAFIKRVRAGKLTPEEKMKIWGQGRYMESIGPERVTGVYFVRPFWPEILPDHDDEGSIEALLEGNPGWAFVVEDDQQDLPLGSAASLEWGQPSFSDEYHGTSWENLKSALPAIARQMDLPPAPYGGEK